MTGEAYFEVAKNAAKPFYVTKGDVEVKVLGTHFNVNAYDDEETVKVTLLEGLVKVSGKNNALTLKPGQQAEAIQNSKFILQNAVNLDQVMAWKNGAFWFNNADVATVMRQLARWYDVEIVYENGVPFKQITGEMGRNLNLSQVLEGLKALGLNAELKGKKLLVKQSG